MNPTTIQDIDDLGSMPPLTTRPMLLAKSMPLQPQVVKKKPAITVPLPTLSTKPKVNDALDAYLLKRSCY